MNYLNFPLCFYLLLLPLFLNAQTNENYALGCVIDNKKYQKVLVVPPLTSRSYQYLPDAYSLKKYCPTPKSQNKIPSCVSWATTFTARTILAAQQENWHAPLQINAETFSPHYIHEQIKVMMNGQCAGSCISDALDFLQLNGAVKWRDCPSPYNNRTIEEIRAQATQYKIDDYFRLSPNTLGITKNTLNIIKKSLENQRPVIIATDCYSSFRQANGASVWNGQKDQLIGGHALAVVGYDDGKYGGAFEIANSWGTKWGNQGFIWVRYDDFVDIVAEAYDMGNLSHIPEPLPPLANNKPRPKPQPVSPTKPKPKPKPKPQPKPAPESMTPLVGNMRLVLETEERMPIQMETNAYRDFKIIKAPKSIYKVTQPYASGTAFRIYFSQAQPAYIYLLGYGSATKKVQQLYPFDAFSPHFTHKEGEVALPSEDYYIALDEQVGQDYLCIIYSTKKLNIAQIQQQLQQAKGSFQKRVQQVLKDKMIPASQINFERNQIAFEAETDQTTQSIVPIIVEMEHVE